MLNESRTRIGFHDSTNIKRILINNKKRSPKGIFLRAQIVIENYGFRLWMNERRKKIANHTLNAIERIVCRLFLFLFFFGCFVFAHFFRYNITFFSIGRLVGKWFSVFVSAYFYWLLLLLLFFGIWAKQREKTHDNRLNIRSVCN